jgi:hypothetical protein
MFYGRFDRERQLLRENLKLDLALRKLVGSVREAKPNNEICMRIDPNPTREYGLFHCNAHI